MAFAIMRAKKLNSMGTVAAALQHCYRDRETPNAERRSGAHTVQRSPGGQIDR
ncbi:TPA: plasmid recombination protein [Escherichia coli]|uniref:plasmid recombination protein n=1 Tax=Escherichia coli TaxID=562 RepID=UPI00203626EE|nr:plasmid recombination protein [Escherichia coli]MDZ8631071.1 plasmid recombination protein [Escherichia coli]MDZ8783860.1 plasmid recombination protein [Escherichia coli]MEA0591539.1 plasmid recombination protein [Escherichia coli]